MLPRIAISAGKSTRKTSNISDNVRHHRSEHLIEGKLLIQLRQGDLLALDREGLDTLPIFSSNLHFVGEVHAERPRSTILVSPTDAREERLRPIELVEEVLAEDRHSEMIT